MALAGTPDDVVAQGGALRGVAGLARVIAFPQAPGDGVAAREEILTMFAEAVLRGRIMDDVMRITWIVAVLALLLGGCASYAWVKPDVTGRGQGA